MTRDEFVYGISDKSKVNVEQVESVLSALKDVILDECRKSNSYVAIPKLGSFRGYKRNKMRRYDINRKSVRTLKERMMIKFTPFPSVIKEINQ